MARPEDEPIVAELEAALKRGDPDAAKITCEKALEYVESGRDHLRSARRKMWMGQGVLLVALFGVLLSGLYMYEVRGVPVVIVVPLTGFCAGLLIHHMLAGVRIMNDIADTWDWGASLEDRIKELQDDLEGR